MEQINLIDKSSYVHTENLPGRKIEFIVIHYTAGVNSRKGEAEALAEWFATSEREASSDFIVDDETFVKYNPDVENVYCWHCGGGMYKTMGGKFFGVCRNRNSIGIEVCSSNVTGKMTEANDGNFYYTDAVIENALKLTKFLMAKYNIDVDHVIRHYDVNGKPCPGIVGWNEDTGDISKWLWFKDRLKDET